LHRLREKYIIWFASNFAWKQQNKQLTSHLKPLIHINKTNSLPLTSNHWSISTKQTAYQFVIGMIFLSGSVSVHFLLFVYIAVVIYLVIKRRQQNKQITSCLKSLNTQKKHDLARKFMSLLGTMLNYLMYRI
jgi:hypothetical protein